MCVVENMKCISLLPNEKGNWQGKLTLKKEIKIDLRASLRSAEWKIENKFHKITRLGGLIYMHIKEY